MGLLDKLWDDVVAGPQPDRGLGMLRNKNAKAVARDLTGLDGDPLGAPGARDPKYRRSSTMVTQSINIRPPPLIRSASFGDESAPATPTGAASSVGSPSSMAGSPGTTPKDNVWRSVFHPGGGRARAVERQGSARYDNVTPNSPSVYDWMYSPESKNKWHHP
ncbi:auxin-repressed 12.5 kDa protein [Selaginella moellendorffii]|uniref:auxin-repressed 12.5 kDa protein n=1 Tax=Selaginella moellendorffii TaxID=88036 RepID=UPI000D1CF3A8|nr:auxin-repressed 12.5 kDa protein [Selaginella moellendorffii]|eukprot:XP_024530998.1 auxin-repressed 12.5 kDa protein [Selaginella moellendorffii]